jgi:hypothetical protein
MSSIDLKQATEKRAEEAGSVASPRRAKSPRKIGGVQGKANLRQMFQESPGMLNSFVFCSSHLIEISTEDFEAMYNTQQNTMQQNVQQNVQYQNPNQQNPNMQQNIQYQNTNQHNPNMQQYSVQQNGMQPTQSFSMPQQQQPDNYNYSYNTYNGMANDTYKSS